MSNMICLVKALQKGVGEKKWVVQTALPQNWLNALFLFSKTTDACGITHTKCIHKLLTPV